MNFIVDNWYLIFLALASGVMLLVPAVKGAGGGVSAAQAVQLINREKAMVIDVCEPAEFAAGHVGGARNIPLAQLPERLPQVAKNKAVPIIMVCAKGGRAARAVGIARGLGYDKAQTLAGGLAAWREANMPVEKS
ncbi:rhodanese-like domain-containing protein [Oryzisolibacter sp. LB2S]|uniref:rhodanese-like domain-containing protein n=1 Tax=Alicycliphilus soli TaxID=3228789 RepID=UPI0034588FED